MCNYPFYTHKCLFENLALELLLQKKKNQLAHMVSETEIMACIDYITAVKYLSSLLFRVDSEYIFQAA